jgi:hypothetical protein
MGAPCYVFILSLRQDRHTASLADKRSPPTAERPVADELPETLVRVPVSEPATT